MTYRYHFGGIEIDSPLEIARLRRAGSHDVVRGTIHLDYSQDDAPLAEEHCFTWPGRFGMQLGRAQDLWRVQVPGGVFLFNHDASQVQIYARPDDLSLVKDLFVRRLLARLAKLKGASIYHAGSLERGGQGILLFGASGAGKSSMSVGLAMAGGWSFFGDDHAIVWAGDTHVMAPAGTDVTIWPRTSEGLALPARHLKTLERYDGKQSFTQGSEAHSGLRNDHQVAPVKGLFFLERRECAGPRLERLDRRSAMEIGLTQIILFNPSGDAARERVDSITQLNRLIAEVPSWKLVYPPSFEVYGAISALIADTLDLKES